MGGMSTLPRPLFHAPRLQPLSLPLNHFSARVRRERREKVCEGGEGGGGGRVVLTVVRSESGHDGLGPPWLKKRRDRKSEREIGFVGNESTDQRDSKLAPFSYISGSNDG